MQGPDALVDWFMALVASMESYTWTSGTDMGNGVTRYTNGTNGGPIFVYVKDGKILRTTPMDLDDTDAGSYTIKARGKTFVPPRKTTLAAHGHCQKSMVYSKNRILKPMKRVDFDPHGERNIQNRGKSKFVEISWEEALDIVSGEIKRCKAVGPGAICVANGSHHQWGNLGHYLSAFNRFWNLIGTTKLVHNPDSWEGWFWGAMHHWGNSMRLGAAEPYGTVEDCLKEADMMVFWSSDPDAAYGFEGTQRRRWAKELGIKMVHIDPYMNHTAAHLGGKWFSPKPGTDAAFAQALCHVWITEGTYDKEFVEKRTTGFAEWKAHVLGEDDGTQDARVAGRRDRHSGARAARTGPRVGPEEDLSRCRWLGLRCRRRLPRTDGRPVGADDDHPRRDAGHGPAGFQLRQPAVRRAGRHELLFSRAMPRAACRATWPTAPTRPTTTSACRTSSP
jgi:anaerobic selenocysteine-containing dehydrogenase